MQKDGEQSQKLSGSYSFFLLGDQGSDKRFIFEYFELEEQELNQEVKLYIKGTDKQHSIEIYDFPTDKLLRNALQLYFRVLPQPSLYLYFLRSDSVDKDLAEWIKVLQNTIQSTPFLFISDVSTYLERQKILIRLAYEFQADVLDIVIFVKLQPYSFRRSLERLPHVGVSIKRANCLKPTVSEKFNAFLKRSFRSIQKKMFRRRVNQAQSVV